MLNKISDSDSDSDSCNRVRVILTIYGLELE